ncbi:hypothetical protein TRFO_23700 [Tritrichomonas foetus]|uniref:CATSPERD/E C-terminal domain-containing protein n=1 Tax=Tritrichomonas foetus TaxID=1144522 RepID=A0A1J4K9A5_9EUKA|nr:hypothetical protein TRFO_23700 [Tritrichomonas foetus]|eukprot:OHT07991.1 hypothetical protein TRFO_23700 [Tritrichomonas foetus]
MLSLFFLIFAHAQSDKVGMYGIFGPVGAPSTFVPGPYSTMTAECRSPTNCSGTWKISAGCWITTNNTSPNIRFVCSQSGFHSIRMDPFSDDDSSSGNGNLSNSQYSSLSFNFEIGKRRRDYIWYIIPDDPVESNFCAKTTLCFPDSNSEIPVKIWISSLVHSSSFQEDPNEYFHISTSPSNESKAITKRFYKLGEVPILTVDGHSYKEEFIFDENQNLWKGNVRLNDQFPHQFILHGNDVADYFSDVSNLTGYFYYTGLIPGFESLFSSAGTTKQSSLLNSHSHKSELLETDSKKQIKQKNNESVTKLFSNLFYSFDNQISDENSIYYLSNNISSSRSTISFCGCFPNIASYNLENDFFITLSNFEAISHVKMNGNDNKLLSIDFNPHYVYAIDSNKKLYYSNGGQWSVIENLNITDNSQVKTSKMCAIAPTSDNKLSPENDYFAVLHNHTTIRVYFSIDEMRFNDYDLSSKTDKIYDFCINSYLLLVIYDLKDSDKLGMTLFDLKLGGSTDQEEVRFLNPKLQTTKSGGFFIYGNKLCFTSDLFSVKYITIPDFFPEENIINLVCTDNNFAFVTDKQRIFYGEMLDLSVINLWSPSNSESLNIFFKGDTLYSIYLEEVNQTQNIDTFQRIVNQNERYGDDDVIYQVKTQFIFANNKELLESQAFCLDCPDHEEYVYIDLDQNLSMSFNVAVFHSEPLMSTVQSPSLVKVDSTYTLETVSCGKLIQLMAQSNRHNINAVEYPNPINTEIEAITKSSCSLYHLNFTASPTGRFQNNYTDSILKTTGSGVVHVILEQGKKTSFAERYQISVQCRPDTRLKIVSGDEYCYSGFLSNQGTNLEDENQENEGEVEDVNSKCTFNALYGLSNFKPKLYLVDGDEEREEVIEDFVLIPVPSMFNEDENEWMPDYEYTVNVNDANCLRQPQNYSNIKKDGIELSKSTYKHCFEPEFDQNGKIIEFDKNQYYEIMNSTSNSINFIGKRNFYVFNLTLLGFQQTYCQFSVLIEVEIKSRALYWWEEFLAAYIAIVLLLNVGIYVFWTNFKYSFSEFLYEMKRMGRC